MKALYIHIPFCEQKCYYCSFVVSIGQVHRTDLYIDCLQKEIKKFSGENISSIYLGGGTPSFLSIEQLERLFEGIRGHFHLQSFAECTIEINPENINDEKAKRLVDIGFNRVSLGVQSLNDRTLKYLGRVHNAHKAIASFSCLRESGFKNINVDLMYGFLNQTQKDLTEDLRKVTDLNSDHISLYSLQIEENSRFFAQQTMTKDHQQQVEDYTYVTQYLNDKGLKQYEISNFAKEGKESKHNINYWQCGNYRGIGIGAHSYVDGRRFSNITKLPHYIDLMKQGKSVEENSETLNNEERFIEAVLLGLRMNQGINIKETEERFQASLHLERKNCIKKFIQEQFLEEEGAYLRATEKGRLVLDDLCGYIYGSTR